MSQETTNTPASPVLKEPILTLELVKGLDKHDQVKWIGPTGPFTWITTSNSWGGKVSQTPHSVHLVNGKVYTLMNIWEDTQRKTFSFYFMRKYVELTEADLSNWTLFKNRHDAVVLREKQKRAWTMASKTFPKVRAQLGEAVVYGRYRVLQDLKDLELSKKMELLTKLTPSELGLLEFLEKDSKNPEEDVKRLFEVYHLYTSQQNEEKGV